MRSGFVIAVLAAAPCLVAQQRPVTSADYARAERFMAYNTRTLVFGTAVRPTWLPDDRFWFRDTTAAGVELILVDQILSQSEVRLTGTKQDAIGHDHGAASAILEHSEDQRHEQQHAPRLSRDGPDDGRVRRHRRGVLDRERRLDEASQPAGRDHVQGRRRHLHRAHHHRAGHRLPTPRHALRRRRPLQPRARHERPRRLLPAPRRRPVLEQGLRRVVRLRRRARHRHRRGLDRRAHVELARHDREHRWTERLLPRAGGDHLRRRRGRL